MLRLKFILKLATRLLQIDERIISMRMQLQKMRREVGIFQMQMMKMMFRHWKFKFK